VIFSIEVTATSYLVRNLPRAFLTAVCASLVYTFAGVKDIFSLFNEDNERVLQFDPEDLVLCTILGVCMGVAGSVFVSGVARLSAMRNHFLRYSLGAQVISQRRFILVLVAATVVGPMVYLDMIYGINADDHAHPLSEIMFRSVPMGLTRNLIVYTLSKFISTILCVCLPLPVGLFTPTFMTGAALGRIFGEILNRYYDSDLSSFRAWEYAVIGAAAFSSGVTRAISTAVVIFELSGQNHLRLPVAVAVLVAYFIGNRFTKNIYDVILDTNGTPYLPDLPRELYLSTAAKVGALFPVYMW